MEHGLQLPQQAPLRYAPFLILLQMQLSNRASEYLEKLHQDQYYTCTEDLAANYLRQNELPAFKPVVHFQTSISGYTFPIAAKPSQSFTASLFSLKDIKEGAPLEYVQVNGKHYFFCGEFATAQFYIVLSEDGEIGTYDESEGKVNPIYSTGEKLIENFALLNYVSTDAVELPPYYTLVDSKTLDLLMEGQGQFSKANDLYNTWYMTDKVIVHKGTWFDRPEFYVHLYGKSLEEAKAFHSLLIEKGIIH